MEKTSASEICSQTFKKEFRPFCSSLQPAGFRWSKSETSGWNCPSISARRLMWFKYQAEMPLDGWKLSDWVSGTLTQRKRKRNQLETGMGAPHVRARGWTEDRCSYTIQNQMSVRLAIFASLSMTLPLDFMWVTWHLTDNLTTDSQWTMKLDTGLHFTACRLPSHDKSVLNASTLRGRFTVLFSS